MSEKKNQANNPAPKGPAKAAGLGLSDFSMSSVRATETQDTTEFTFRLWRMLVWFAVLLVLAGAVLWWFKQGRDLFWSPDINDQQFLVSLGALPDARGLAQNLRFEGRDTIGFDLAPGISVFAEEQQPRIRQAVRALVAAFSNHRPGEMVRVKGYEQGELVADGLWRHAAQKTESRDPDASIWVHLEGETKGIGTTRSFD